MPVNRTVIRSGQSIPLGECPVATMDELRDGVIRGAAGGMRISALTVYPSRTGPVLLAVLSDPVSGNLELIHAEAGDSYPSITPDLPSAHLFEGLIHEQWKIKPLGHPRLNPVRFPDGDRGKMRFLGMTGGAVHEVAVGPVHAGVIEPGHFRFLCHGETVKHLEISLGYQHRGIENMLRGGPGPKTLHYAQTAAGDTTIGHASACCLIHESLSETRVPARAEAIRAIAGELERIANHIGDLGAMAGDIGFLPTMNYCGRIRGDVLNITAILCGNRFGRGLLLPGGTAFDVTGEEAAEIEKRLESIEGHTTSAVELMFATPSVMARLEGTGTVTMDTAEKLGLTGVAARGCGIHADVRNEFPYGMYQFFQIPVCTWASGDCFARACVRWLEIKQSFRFIRELLKALPEGPFRSCDGVMRPGMLSAVLTEGWRGEICHLAATDLYGRFEWYRIFDPSLRNWEGLAMAMREGEISDFPLCNKSFNLSYCGHDL